MACSNLHSHTVPALAVWSVEYREVLTCHFLDWVIKDSGFSGFSAGLILSLSFSLFTYWGSHLLYCQLSFGEAHMARNSSPQSNTNKERPGAMSWRHSDNLWRGPQSGKLKALLTTSEDQRPTSNSMRELRSGLSPSQGFGWGSSPGWQVIPREVILELESPS